MKRGIIFAVAGLVILALAIIVFLTFCDEAVFTRKNTLFSVNTPEKLVALTFDDGPSPEWTPRILEELDRAGVKATFFMIGEHVEKYPAIAKQVALAGHEIGNHSYDHSLLIWSGQSQLQQEILKTERVIREATGQTPKYFRPPRSWLTGRQKEWVEEMGYTTVLWSLNSKDWVTFDDKYIVRFIMGRIRPGDIVLFHDGGGIFGTEGRNREETAKTVADLTRRLREKGYRCVTVSELIEAARSAS